MKGILKSALIFAITCSPCLHAGQFEAAAASPELTVNSVKRDPEDPRLLAISVTIGALGDGRIALAQDQFTVSISTEREPWLFGGDAIFPKTYAKRFEIHRGKPETVTLKVAKDNFGKKESWEALPNGIYKIQVRLNSGKTPEFDFQWLGQTYSKPKTLKLPLAEQGGAGQPATAPVSKPEGKEKPKPESKGRSQ